MARRGCFVSGVLAVIVLIVLRRFFRLPPLGIVALAGALWFGFLVLYVRSGGGRRR